MKVSLTVDKYLWDKYKVYCKDKGMKMSTRVNILIEKDMKGEINAN